MNDGIQDALDHREFYELCQQYRHSAMGAVEFEELKEWLRLNAVIKTKPVNLIYET
mgnify:CR=1 FL=1